MKTEGLCELRVEFCNRPSFIMHEYLKHLCKMLSALSKNGKAFANYSAVVVGTFWLDASKSIMHMHIEHAHYAQIVMEGKSNT